ncbi:MAG: UDP-galactopyranose mutase [Deltaproteobacteria bacterium]|nr:UDP-galactopyranose mutase [Deltaproteobacteria bacterium]
MKVDVLIVGLGFAGSTTARVLAEKGHAVHLIDKRSHIGGNAYDCVDAHGLLIHPYGPHIFHTNSQNVFDFLSRFTEWIPYEHRVLAKVGEQLLPIPINRTTINALYGLALDEAGVAAYLERVRDKREGQAKTSEDVVLSSVGSDLCEKFFRGYTKKQWGLDLSELAAGVAARIPTRTNEDDRYFTDTHQQMPKDGYTRMFERMLDHPKITFETNVDFFSARDRYAAKHVVYTGPIDAYFDYRFGKLPYRSLEFVHEHLPDTESFQRSATVNYPNEQAFTRITEFKKITGQTHKGTSIVREYPRGDGDPYYPVPRPDNEALFRRYDALAQAEKGVTFVGRLAQYRYYNMDQVTAAALTRAEELAGSLVA